MSLDSWYAQPSAHENIRLLCEYLAGPCRFELDEILDVLGNLSKYGDELDEARVWDRIDRPQRFEAYTCLGCECGIEAITGQCDRCARIPDPDAAYDRAREER